MNTFLPYADFVLSARALDDKRLGKQRVEALQILRAIGAIGASESSRAVGWRRHPAVLMWNDHGVALAQYALACCDEWTTRGFVDTTRKRVLQELRAGAAIMPRWLGDDRLHLSHRAALLVKWEDDWLLRGRDSSRIRLEAYRPEWGEPPLDYAYWWPPCR